MKQHYLIEVEGGVEPIVHGPYHKGDDRVHAAKRIHRRQEEDDGLFWAEINEKSGLSVGSYAAGFFWEDSAEDDL